MGRFKKRKIYEKTGREVLDVGCSYGRYALFAHECGRFVVGVDNDFRRLHKARESGLAVAVADAASLPFVDNSFDTVVLFDILEHISDDVAVIKEAARVARTNMLISVPKSDTYPRYDSGLTYRSYTDPTHLRYYTEGSISRILLEAGLSRFSVEHFSKVRPLLFYRRIGIPVFVLKLFDYLIQMVGRNDESFYQTLFVDVRLD